MGLNIKAAIPEGYDPPLEILQIVTRESKLKATDFTILRDPIEAVKNTDIVVTDTFVSIGKRKRRWKEKINFYSKISSKQQTNELLKGRCNFYALFTCKKGSRSNIRSDRWK